MIGGVSPTRGRQFVCPTGKARHWVAVARTPEGDVLLDSLLGGPVWLQVRAKEWLAEVPSQGGGILKAEDSRPAEMRNRDAVITDYGSRRPHGK